MLHTLGGAVELHTNHTVYIHYTQLYTVAVYPIHPTSSHPPIKQRHSFHSLIQSILLLYPIYQTTFFLYPISYLLLYYNIDYIISIYLIYSI